MPEPAKFDTQTGLPIAPAAAIPPARTAGFVPRLAAFLIDHAIVGVLQLAVWLIFHLWDSVFSTEIWFQYTGNALIMAALSALYFTLLTGFCGTTAGKALMQLKVQSTDGTQPGWGSVIYRETVGRFLTGILCIGYIVLAFDAEHRGFHDRLSDTRVVYRF